MKNRRFKELFSAIQAGDYRIKIVGAAFKLAVELNQIAYLHDLLNIPKVRAHAAVDNNFLLRWAAEHGHLDMVNRLLEIPAVVNNDIAFGGLAVRLAEDKGHWEIVKHMLTIPAYRASSRALLNSPCRASYSELICAVIQGRLDILKKMLAVPKIRNAVAADNSAALKAAAEHGHSDIVRCVARTIWQDSGVNGMPVDIQHFIAGEMTIRAHIERASEKLLFANTLFKYHEKVSSLPGFNSNESPYGDNSGPWGKIKGYLNGPGC